MVNKNKGAVGIPCDSRQGANEDGVLRFAQDDRGVTTEAIAWVLRFAQDDSGWDRRLHTVPAPRFRAHAVLKEASTHLRVIQVCFTSLLLASGCSICLVGGLPRVDRNLG